MLTNSSVISDNTASVAENKAATDDNIAAKMTFAALESTIQVLTSGLTIATEALNLVKVKEGNSIQKECCRKRSRSGVKNWGLREQVQPRKRQKVLPA